SLIVSVAGALVRWQPVVEGKVLTQRLPGPSGVFQKGPDLLNCSLGDRINAQSDLIHSYERKRHNT
ncbi:hypothetical protein PO909_017339, partial [Leuciscus waleckii]